MASSRERHDASPAREQGCPICYLKNSSWLRDSDGKESTCNAGNLGLNPGSGRSPGEENGYLLQYSCLENSMDREAWWVYSPWGHKEWGRTWVTNTFHFSCYRLWEGSRALHQHCPTCARLYQTLQFTGSGEPRDSPSQDVASSLSPGKTRGHMWAMWAVAKPPPTTAAAAPLPQPTWTATWGAPLQTAEAGRKPPDLIYEAGAPWENSSQKMDCSFVVATLGSDPERQQKGEI